MKQRETDGMKGPVVQKREVLLMVGLIASWIVAVYFLVSAPKHRPDFSHSRKAAVHLSRSAISPAILKRHLEEPLSGPDSYEPEMFEPMEPGLVDGIFRSMKQRSGERPSWFGSLISSEAAPPVVSDQTLVLEEVIRGADQQTTAPEEASEQEGEFLENEPVDVPSEIPSAIEPVPSEPIKS